MRFTVAPTPTAVSEALRGRGVRACCFAPSDAPRGNIEREAAEFASAQDALEAVVAADPAYRWCIAEAGLVNLFPQDSVIERAAPAVHVTDEGLWAVVERNLRLDDYGIELFAELRDGDGPPVSLDLSGVSLREALNACLAPVDRTFWHLSGVPDAFYLTISGTK
jgi:hypothetical protein